MRLTIILLILLAGWVESGQAGEMGKRQFYFYRDTFSFVNELLWDYYPNEEGELAMRKRSPRPKYFNRCFPLLLSGRKFFYHAEFRAGDRLEEQRYEQLIRRVLAKGEQPKGKSVVVPGYGGLREFSADHEPLLKRSCGRMIRSYVKRGNWRVAFPFTRGQQEREAARIERNLREGKLPIVHVVDLVRLNHALLVYAAYEEDGVVFFHCYDPNDNSRPGVLLFDKEQRTFHLPPTPYYLGGAVNAYEVYRNFFY
jgi:hypothetical protein